MAYQTYITDALVCDSRDNNTSDKSYLLFTRDAGMLWASAKSVREERSKHRYALQVCSLIRVSLVRGKGGWKVVGTEPGSNAYYSAKTREERALIRNVIRLLVRFMHGETVHTRMYDDVTAVFERAPQTEPHALEAAIALRLLNELGYIAPKAEYARFFEPNFSYDQLGEITAEELRASRQAIDHALHLSHL